MPFPPEIAHSYTVEARRVPKTVTAEREQGLADNKVPR